MTKFSLTYAASLATLLASLTFLEQAEALDIINAVLLLAGSVATIYGRYRAGGLKNIWGIKK